MVEVASGKTLDVAVKERVTGPLGMTDTGFWQPAANKARFAEPLAASNIPGIGNPYYDDTQKPVLLSGGGGISSTAEDYLRFALMLQGDGAYKGVRILKPESVAKMREDQTTPAIRKAGVKLE